MEMSVFTDSNYMGHDGLCAKIILTIDAVSDGGDIDDPIDVEIIQVFNSDTQQVIEWNDLHPADQKKFLQDAQDHAESNAFELVYSRFDEDYGQDR